jgi:hypothetical protein
LAITLAIIPSTLSLIVLLGMLYRGARLVSDQMTAIQENTKAIQLLTHRLLKVENVNRETNVIATDIQHKVGNGDS